MENKPATVQIFKIVALLFAVSIFGLFSKEITTTANGISTLIISETP